MSKSYKKNVKAFIATGDNREFYKMRRRKLSNASKQQLRNLVANYDPEEIDDKWVEPIQAKTDKWREPTDGHFTINNEIIKQKDREDGYNDYYHQKYDKILKNKHQKH